MTLDEKARQRFLDKVDLRLDPEACWLWTAYTDKRGYGKFGIGSKVFYAHRVAYEHFVGTIPEGLELDHLCRTPGCVRPDHMEAVTHVENIARGESPPAQAARKTHCVQGHEFNEENTYIRPDTGHRQCVPCKKVAFAAWQERQSA